MCLICVSERKCANIRFNSFFYEIDVEDFELAVTGIILLRRVRKRFKRKPKKQWVRAIFKEWEKGHIANS